MKSWGICGLGLSALVTSSFPIPVWSSSASFDELPLYVVGSAYDRDSQELLYSEYHYCSTDALQCKVEYIDDSDELITHKILDYSRSLNSPELFVKAYRKEEDQRLAVSDIEDVVVDAGFDNFVRSRWDDLAGGTAVIFPFQPLGFDKPLTMRASKRDSKSDESECAESNLCLIVRVDSWLLGLIARPIELV